MRRHRRGSAPMTIRRGVRNVKARFIIRGRHGYWRTHNLWNNKVPVYLIKEKVAQSTKVPTGTGEIAPRHFTISMHLEFPGSVPCLPSTGSYCPYGGLVVSIRAGTSRRVPTTTSPTRRRGTGVLRVTTSLKLGESSLSRQRRSRPRGLAGTCDDGVQCAPRRRL